MVTASYFLTLSRDEERIAQLLTRDAWVYFSSQISQRELFHVKEIPMMPRRGEFEITNDAEVIQYYLDLAASYSEELTLVGWSPDQIASAVESLVDKLESATGLQRGMSLGRVGVA